LLNGFNFLDGCNLTWVLGEELLLGLESLSHLKYFLRPLFEDLSKVNDSLSDGGNLGVVS
jgi:hypothetical protein